MTSNSSVLVEVEVDSRIFTILDLGSVEVFKNSDVFDLVEVEVQLQALFMRVTCVRVVP